MLAGDDVPTTWPGERERERGRECVRRVGIRVSRTRLPVRVIGARARVRGCTLRIRRASEKLFLVLRRTSEGIDGEADRVSTDEVAMSGRAGVHSSPRGEKDYPWPDSATP